MTAGRVVYIAYYFPPLVGIASERAASMATHLRGCGWEPVVITARSGFYHRVGEVSPTPFPVVRTRSLELSRILRRAYAASTDTSGPNDGLTVRAVQARGGADRLRRFVRDFVYVPDAQVGWIPFANGAANRALREASGPRVLFSSSVPYSAHLAAMRAARSAGVPWVAELRDPWSTGAWSDRSRARRWLDRTLERRVLRSADHVVVTSESTRRVLLQAGAITDPDRISVVANGFEPAPERRPPPGDQPMTILHAGTVAEGEDMAPLLAILDRIHARHPGAFRLRVLGPTEAWQSEAAAHPDRAWLHLDGVVSPERAREAMAESSVLLLVRTHAGYRTILPGKAFEYIGARRPILGVVVPDSEMESLVRDHADARLVDPGRIDGLGDAVERLLAEHRAGQIQEARVPEALVMPLRRSEQARKLAAIFAEVVR